MKEQKVLCVRDYNMISSTGFKKGRVYTFNENGILDDGDYRWQYFLNAEGNTFLEKWDNYYNNGERESIFVTFNQQSAKTFNFKCDDFQMKEGYVLEMHSDSFTINNKIGCPVYTEFEDGRWCHMKYGEDYNLSYMENSYGVVIDNYKINPKKYTVKELENILGEKIEIISE